MNKENPARIRGEGDRHARTFQNTVTDVVRTAERLAELQRAHILKGMSKYLQPQGFIGGAVRRWIDGERVSGWESIAAVRTGIWIDQTARAAAVIKIEAPVQKALYLV